MPNNITTQVEITGTKEQISKLIKNTKIKLDADAETNEFDFNGIVKMPDELLNTVSPTIVFDTQEEVDAENERHHKVWQNNQVKAITKKEAERRQAEYNALNWYDWSYANWGTKWNAYDVHYTAHDDTKLVVQIDTAWDTPHEIWRALEEQGYTVKGIMYGEMEGYEYIGDGASVFSAYTSVEVEYEG